MNRAAMQILNLAGCFAGSWTWSPTTENRKEIGQIHYIVCVGITEAAGWARAPLSQHREKVGDADVSVAVEVAQALAFVRDPVDVQIRARPVHDVSPVRDEVRVAVLPGLEGEEDGGTLRVLANELTSCAVEFVRTAVWVSGVSLEAAHEQISVRSELQSTGGWNGSLGKDLGNTATRGIYSMNEAGVPGC